MATQICKAIGVLTECELPISAFDLNGGLGGIQAGYNWQSDSLVFGVEIDGSLMGWADTVYNCDGSCTSSGTAEIDALASLRGRLGFAIADRSLLYVTGGLAYVDGDFDGMCSDACGSVKLNDFGGVIGGGFEHAIADNVSVRAEGLYYIFDGSHSLSSFDEFTTGDSVGVDDVLVGRISFNWLLGR